MTKIQPWKTINTKSLLDTEHLKVAEDTVILPNGREKAYVRFAPSQPGSVIVIAINQKQEVLIQQEYSYPPNKVMWQLPGGSIEEGEEIIDAANRELSEESGYIGKKTDVIGYFYTANRLSDQKQHVVVCQDLVKSKLPENEDEFIESYWMSQSELLQKIKKGEFDNINLLAALNIWFNTTILF